MLLSIFILILSLAYGMSIIYGASFIRSHKAKAESSVADVSLVIVFRNEAENLPSLLALLHKYADDCEFVFVDDGSTDGGGELIEKHLPSAILLTQKPLGKKVGLRKAMEICSKKFIATLDADVTPTPGWLGQMRAYAENADYVAGPVLPQSSKESFFSLMLSLEWLSLQAMTEASIHAHYPLMSNGANSIFTKDLWEQAQLVREDEALASGDDVFLLEAAVMLDKRVRHASVREAAVFTEVPQSLQALWRQRSRWASKTPSYQRLFPKIIAFLVFFVCLMQIFAWAISVKLWLMVWMIKLFTDYAVLNKISKKYHQSQFMRYYLITALFYPLYVCLIAFDTILRIFTKSKSTNPHWK